MILIFIYEEVQGDAFIQTLDEYERINEVILHVLQRIINDLFEALNATYKPEKIKLISRMRVCSLLTKERK